MFQLARSGRRLLRTRKEKHTSTPRRYLVQSDDGLNRYPEDMRPVTASPKKAKARKNTEHVGDRTGIILDVAMHLFLEHGYSRTSTREIARLAGASKETLYQCFPTKALLFTALMEKRVNDVFGTYAGLTAAGLDPYQALSSLGERLLAVSTHPDTQRLLQVVIAEAKEFPELSSAYWEKGPGRSRKAVEAYLHTLVEQKRMPKQDIGFAAEQFIGALLGSVALRNSLRLPDFIPDERSRRLWAQKTVQAFFRAFSIQ